MITNLWQKHTWFTRIFYLSSFVLIVLVFFMTIYLSSMDKKLKSLTYPNVFIDKVNIGNKTKEEVIALFEDKENGLKNTQLSVSYNGSTIATYSAQTLDIHINTVEVYEKAYLVGRSPNMPSRIYQQIATLFRLNRFFFDSQVQYDLNVIVNAVSQFQDSYDKKPKNALFKFENDRVVSFQKEEAGSKLLTDVFLKDIDQSLRSLKYRQQNVIVKLQERPIQPEITLSNSNNFGIEELIGEGVSNYSHSIPGRIHNVILGATKLNGILIPKGKTFSFNQSIGDISASTGYQPAYIIKDGKTVLGDGGGICQVSTTLFRAALNSGLPITERYAHAYRVSYYENDSKPGLDATVFAPSVDLKFENNTSAAILIQTSVDKENMILYFKLYGKKDGRNAEISTPILSDVAPPPPAIYQDDPTIKRGQIKQVDFPAWGGKTVFNYKVTRAGEVIFEKKFVSWYKPWTAVFLVGTQD